MSTSDHTPPRALGYEFGEFALDVEGRTLFRRHRPVPVQDLVLKALVALVDRPGEIVSRRELEDHLWSGAAVAAEQGINTVIYKLRRQLRDSASHPRFIETVPGYGYRFRAEVRRCAIAGPNGIPTASGWRSVWSDRRPGISLLVGAPLLGILGLFGWIAAQGVDREPATPDRTVQAPNLEGVVVAESCDDERTVSIAVLPLRAAGSQGAGQRLANALSEDIVAALWDVDELRLAARRVWSEGPGESYDYILQGLVDVAGETIRMEMWLLAPGDADPVWQKSYESPTTEPYLLRDLVASDIAQRFAA